MNPLYSPLVFAIVCVIFAPAAHGEENGPVSGSEIESVQELRDRLPDLRHTVIQGLDLRKTYIDWSKAKVSDAVFFGCSLTDADAKLLVKQGATLFPRLSNRPYNPYRSALYTPGELREGFASQKDHSVDRQIYDHFVKHGKFDPPILEAVAQRIHDHAIDDALREHLGMNDTGLPKKKVVAIMGGHSAGRDDPFYEKVALLTQLLTQEGFHVATGGGPGMMEAGNLGAYLARYDSKAVKDAVAMLAKAPKYDHADYHVQAGKVLKKYPQGRQSLAIPTWFYGHEPSNVFGSHVAKYFSNGIREDILLSTAVYGVVFAPGSAGTTQEVFMDATQNHYGTFGYYSPMAFLGTKRYTRDTKIYPLLKDLAKGRDYEPFLTISDDHAELVKFIKTHPPKKKP